MAPTRLSSGATGIDPWQAGTDLDSLPGQEEKLPGESHLNRAY
jgi:hypothetical protein